MLLACHVTNATAQSVQLARFYNYWYNGGREQKLGLTAEMADVVKKAEDSVQEAVSDKLSKSK